MTTLKMALEELQAMAPEDRPAKWLLQMGQRVVEMETELEKLTQSQNSAPSQPGTTTHSHEVHGLCEDQKCSSCQNVVANIATEAERQVLARVEQAAKDVEETEAADRIAARYNQLTNGDPPGDDEEEGVVDIPGFGRVRV